MGNLSEMLKINNREGIDWMLLGYLSLKDTLLLSKKSFSHVSSTQKTKTPEIIPLQLRSREQSFVSPLPRVKHLLGSSLGKVRLHFVGTLN